MPVSQLDVLLSYHLWVQLVRSEFHHKIRIEWENEEKAGKRRKRRKNLEIRNGGEKLTQKEAHKIDKKKKKKKQILGLSFCRCGLSYNVTQLFNIPPFFETQKQDLTNMRRAGIPFWLRRRYPQYHLITHSFQWVTCWLVGAVARRKAGCVYCRLNRLKTERSCRNHSLC